jgi:hypothetical protein
VIDNIDAMVMAERAKREAAALLHTYERELAGGGRWVECVELGIIRHLMTAPIDFLNRVDALRAICPEIDHARSREDVRQKIRAWEESMSTVEHEAGPEGPEGGA